MTLLAINYLSDTTEESYQIDTHLTRKLKEEDIPLLIMYPLKDSQNLEGFCTQAICLEYFEYNSRSIEKTLIGLEP